MKCQCKNIFDRLHALASMTTKVVRLNPGHYAKKFLLYDTTMYICRQLKIKSKLCTATGCFVAFCMTFIHWNEAELFRCLPQLFCCLPLWKIVLKSLTLFPLVYFHNSIIRLILYLLSLLCVFCKSKEWKSC